MKFLKRQQKRPPEEHIHVFWYCSLSHGSRFLDVEADFIEAVAKFVPGIVVLTQCLGPNHEEANQYRSTVRALLDEHGAQVGAGSPIMALSLARTIGGHTIEPFGLTDLVAATYELLPEGVKRAFSNTRGRPSAQAS